MKYPNSHRSILLGFLLACCACCGGGPWAAEAADVAGYSVLKGHFLLQEGPGTPATDPDFAYSILAAVELTEPATVTNATLRTPGGAVNVLDDLSDSWDFLDTRDTLSQLTSAYGWGNYTVTFGTLHDGNYSCVLSLPNTALPPAPHLTNFAAIQAVNPLRDFTVYWDFPSAPNASDFVQVYITDGHDVVFATPDFGQPGALNGAARSAVIPAGTLDANSIVSLNLEITRVVSTNATTYPAAAGIAGVFRSTELDLTTINPPRMKILPPTNGMVVIEVRGSAARTNVLQSSGDFVSWRNDATNVAPLGKSVFSVRSSNSPARFFRAWQP
jgi:hypothetical protein